MSTPTPSSRSVALLAALVLSVTFAATARADDDPMAPYRGRFQSGMERYKAGDVAGAVAQWEPIYTDVGNDKGYRVAFDLGRAYDKLNNPPLASARYRAFLQRVDARRAQGDAIEPVVAQEETEARARVAQIGDVSEPPAAKAVSPAAPVPPAAPDTPVATGVPVTPLPPAPAATPSPTPVPAPRPTPPSPSPPLAATTEHPFSPWVVVAGGALTVGASVVCVLEYAHALSTKSEFNAASNDPVATQGAIRDTYDDARPIAYGALGATVGLAAVTGALTTWYFAGTKRSNEGGAPQVSAAPAPHGLQVGLSTRF